MEEATRGNLNNMRDGKRAGMRQRSAAFFSELSGLCCKEGVPRVWVRGGGCECLVGQFSWPQRNICSGCCVPLHRGVLSITGEAKLMTVRTQRIFCCLGILGQPTKL